MITFDDVRKTPETTYFFFSRYRHQALVFGLRSAGVTDYEIIKVPEALKRLPANFQVPEVRSHATDPTPTKAISVFVSSYDVRDLEAKLAEIEESEDFYKHIMNQSQQIMERHHHIYQKDA